MTAKKQTRIRSFMATVVLVGAMLLAFLPATPASATTWQNTGSPGAVVVYKVQGLHYNACAGTLITCYNPDVFVPAPYVYRSPALAGNQVVTHLTYLYRLSNSRWVLIATRSEARTLVAGTRGGYLRSEEFRLGQAGSYLVTVGLSWSNPARTRQYGTKHILFNNAGDYQCLGRFTASCNARYGYVYLRSPGL